MFHSDLIERIHDSDTELLHAFPVRYHPRGRELTGSTWLRVARGGEVLSLPWRCDYDATGHRVQLTGTPAIDDAPTSLSILDARMDLWESIAVWLTPGAWTEALSHYVYYDGLTRPVAPGEYARIVTVAEPGFSGDRVLHAVYAIGAGRPVYVSSDLRAAERTRSAIERAGAENERRRLDTREPLRA